METHASPDFLSHHVHGTVLTFCRFKTMEKKHKMCLLYTSVSFCFCCYTSNFLKNEPFFVSNQINAPPSLNLPLPPKNKKKTVQNAQKRISGKLKKVRVWNLLPNDCSFPLAHDSVFFPWLWIFLPRLH